MFSAGSLHRVRLPRMHLEPNARRPVPLGLGKGRRAPMRKRTRSLNWMNLPMPGRARTGWTVTVPDAQATRCSAPGVRDAGTTLIQQPPSFPRQVAQPHTPITRSPRAGKN